MATNYTGNATPTLSNAPANAWTDDAAKASHVGNTYLVTGSGGTAGNVYAFEEYPTAAVKEVPASGLPAEIVTITDGGENLPMTSAEVSLSPQQDLNGYDSPWPGGGGKNKLGGLTNEPQTYNSITITPNGDGTFTANGTNSGGSSDYKLGGTTPYAWNLAPGNYYLNGGVIGLNGSGNTLYIAIKNSASGSSRYAGTNSYGVGTAFTIEEGEYISAVFIRAAAGATATNALFKPMIRLASESDATFAPYSNICPITGHDSATLWDDPKYGGTIAWNQFSQKGGGTANNCKKSYDSASGETTCTPSGYTSNAVGLYALTGNAERVRGHKYFQSVEVNPDYDGQFLFGYNSAIAKTISSGGWTVISGIVSWSTASMILYVKAQASGWTTGGFKFKNVQCIDLTLMFGATIADYIYSLETANAGAGVAWFRALFPKDYYAYDAGTASCVSKVNGAPYREYPVTFPQTVYGGTYDFVSGKLTVTWANIASYNGETLPGEWLSSMDAYSSGTTPTTGAQVVYELATPIEYTLSAQQIETLLGENNVWSDAGEISNLVYRSNQYVMAYDWFETWTMPKITRNNGNIIVLPYPQEYTPEIYDVDASTTGRNAAGTMIRDRVAVKHKFNYKFPPLGQADATEILNAVRDSSFTLTTASPETGAKTNYRVYVGDRSLPVYWMPNHNNASWLYSSLSLNLIEM